jgi:hypothetical protein
MLRKRQVLTKFVINPFLLFHPILFLECDPFCFIFYNNVTIENQYFIQ